MKRNLPITNKEVTYGDDVVIISTTDLKGSITYVNQDFIDISGYSEQELIGKNHNIIRHPDMPPAAFQDLWDTVKAGKSWRGVVKNRCKNGDHYWVDAYVTPVYEGERVIGYQSVRSLPSRKAIEQAQAIYAKLNNNQIKTLPRQHHVSDIGLRPRIFAGLALLFLLTLIVAGISGYTASYQEGLMGQHSQRIMRLEDGWNRFKQGAIDRSEMERRIQGLASETGPDGLIGRMDKSAALSRNLIIATGIAGLLAVLLIGVLLVRTVVKPVERVTAIAKRIAGGELTQNIEANTQDEVGEMFQAMKLMQARLRTVLGRFSEVTTNLIGMADTVSTSSARTADSMQHQSAETEQVAAAINEMAATVQEVAHNTAEAAEAAAGAESAAHSGIEVVQTTRNSIEALAREVEQTAGVIHKLEEDGQSISTVMGVIRAIAEQTNLLALNAAIEAARAGEQGRGFAVVADEVRNLAQRTQEATGEIDQVVQHLLDGIRNAVGVMSEGQTQAESTVDHAKRTAEALDAINQAVGIINNMNTQIAAAANQQTEVAEELNRKVVSINTLTEQTLGSTHAFTANGAALAEMATKLQEFLAQFNLGKGKRFDFSNARNAHLAWKSKLRAFLDGDNSVLNAAQATSHHECALGKWYYSSGMQQYGGIPEMKAIEEPHAQLHRIIHEIIEAKDAGRLDEAERLFREVEPLSRTVVRLLDEVEKKVKQG